MCSRWWKEYLSSDLMDVVPSTVFGAAKPHQREFFWKLIFTVARSFSQANDSDRKRRELIIKTNKNEGAAVVRLMGRKSLPGPHP